MFPDPTSSELSAWSVRDPKATQHRVTCRSAFGSGPVLPEAWSVSESATKSTSFVSSTGLRARRASGRLISLRIRNQINSVLRHVVGLSSLSGFETLPGTGIESCHLSVPGPESCHLSVLSPFGAGSGKLSPFGAGVSLSLSVSLSASLSLSVAISLSSVLAKPAGPVPSPLLVEPQNYRLQMDTMCNKSTCPSSILRDLLPVLCPGDDPLETRLRMPEVASTTERRGSDGGCFRPYVWASLQLKFSGVIRNARQQSVPPWPHAPEEDAEASIERLCVTYYYCLE